MSVFTFKKLSRDYGDLKKIVLFEYLKKEKTFEVSISSIPSTFDDNFPHISAKYIVDSFRKLAKKRTNKKIIKKLQLTSVFPLSRFLLF